MACPGFEFNKLTNNFKSLFARIARDSTIRFVRAFSLNSPVQELKSGYMCLPLKMSGRTFVSRGEHNEKFVGFRNRTSKISIARIMNGRRVLFYASGFGARKLHFRIQNLTRRQKSDAIKFDDFIEPRKNKFLCRRRERESAGLLLTGIFL